LVMYKFLYEYLKPTFKNRLKLLYMDTDSFIYQIESDDVYEEMLPEIQKGKEGWFDTSNYPVDHPCYFKDNKDIPGKMKDEMKGNHIDSVVCLNPKMYSVDAASMSKRVAKGLPKTY